MREKNQNERGKEGFKNIPPKDKKKKLSSLDSEADKGDLTSYYLAPVCYYC